MNTCSKTRYFEALPVIQAARELISTTSRQVTSHPYLGSLVEIGQPPLEKSPKSYSWAIDRFNRLIASSNDPIWVYYIILKISELRLMV